MKRHLLMPMLMALCAVLLNSSAFAGTSESSISEQCRDTCVTSLNYLQKHKSASTAANQIETLRDCIKLCDTNNDLSKRNSPFAGQVEKICAEACRKCAAACEELKDPHLKDCVAMCNHCANHCEVHHH